MKRTQLFSLLTRAITFVIIFSCTPGMATGLMTCQSGDKSNWKSAEVLEEIMLSEGWKVRRIKEDGGCYEAYGTTPEGQRVEAYFHPVTLEKLLVARRGQILFRKEN